ncbi:hypothetical protein PG593_10860 [Riemerella anatipestifer]|nr:hypothetical protein [Riemerella anatipestifer]MDY3326124.1 hypothetical protein [Riemerella anatipestifer]MDY3354474.1 hypothetical protein [Riemerella anatipestifer]MDY3530273.1 hypothetical protein [Riemerella anatipestifer]
MKKLILLFTIPHIFGDCNGQKNENIIKSEEIIYYKFDDNNNLVRRNGIGYDEFNTYNEQGKIQERSILIWNDFTKKDEVILIEKYHYHKDTSLVKTERFDISGEKYGEIENLYNQSNLLEKTITHSFENGKEVFKQNVSFYKIFEYGSKSEKAKVYGYDEASKDFKLIYTEISTFDDRQNLKEKKLIDPKNEVYEINDYVYNENQQVIEKNQKLRFPSKINYSYNSNKDIEKWTYTSEDYKGETVYTYTYKYDDKGNWIEKKETCDNEKYLIKRKLEYY